MKVIKFRGKLAHSGETIIGNLIIANDGRPYIIPPDLFTPDGHHLLIESDDAFWVKPESVGQFTGLTDKNGKEIYEGDCFTDGSLAGDFGGMKRFIGVIGFENGCFVVIKSNCDCGECLKDRISRYGEQDIEVIGNIYENPNLLQ